MAPRLDGAEGLYYPPLDRGREEKKKIGNSTNRPFPVFSPSDSARINTHTHVRTLMAHMAGLAVNPVSY